MDTVVAVGAFFFFRKKSFVNFETNAVLRRIDACFERFRRFCPCVYIIGVVMRARTDEGPTAWTNISIRFPVRAFNFRLYAGNWSTGVSRFRAGRERFRNALLGEPIALYSVRVKRTSIRLHVHRRTNDDN